MCLQDDIGMSRFHGRRAKSHDISSIKHLWDLFGRKVREWNDVNNSMDLARALHKKWDRIPMAVVQRLIPNMTRRCGDAWGVNGGQTI